MLIDAYEKQAKNGNLLSPPMVRRHGKHWKRGLQKKVLYRPPRRWKLTKFFTPALLIQCYKDPAGDVNVGLCP